MISFWEKQSFINSDFLIVGSGITGLSTALSLRERFPKSEITILERGVFPSGASTKNAGFACIGSLTELLSDLENIGDDEILALIESRRKGLEKLRKRLGDKRLDYKQYGGYELITENELYAVDKLESMNTKLFPLFGEPVFSLKNALIDDFGFNKKLIKALLFNPFEGQIDTGRMMRSLLQLAVSKLINIYTGVTVKSIEDEGEVVQIQVEDNINEDVFFQAQKVIVCTNAFTKKLLHNVNIIPGRGQVLATAPIKSLKFKGTFHFEKGFYYFRNFGKRVIFGGGRNLDIKGEATTQIGNTDLVINTLKEKLQQIILPNQAFTIEHTWAGIMAFGAHKNPIIKHISKNVVVAARLGGMGVAIGTNVGEQASSLIAQ